MKLRHYQERALNEVRRELEICRAVMVQAPTGAGKSIILSELIKSHIGSSTGKKKNKVLFCVDRVELVKQIIKTLWKNQLYVGTIMGKEMPDYSADVQVASIMTLNKRSKPDCNLIIIDEAHATPSESYRKLWELYPDAKFCGFTATPIRLSGDGFTDLFDKLVQTVSIQELIDTGYLVPINHYICSVPEIDKVETKNGEYVEESAFAQLKTAPIIEAYEEHCKGKKGIVFATNVEHSKLIEAKYNAIGVKCKHLDSKTPEAERNKAIEMFRRGEIQILTNVELFITGFDVPDVDFVQLIRMTKSLSYYLQMIGRATRPLAGVADKAETDEERVLAIANSSKPNCIVLDHAGMFFLHGLGTDDRDWQHYFSRKKKKTATKEVSEKLMAGEDKEGKIHITHIPSELSGMKLVQVKPEMILLREFTNILNNALIRGHKLLSAYIKFENYLQNKKLSWSDDLFAMVSSKLLEMNNSSNLDVSRKFNKAFLYYKKKEIFSK